jgi:F0F1-type ATP synthase epsilon subunit
MKVTPALMDSYQGSTPAHDGAANQNDLFFFIDGGSALVAQNTVTVIAYDALALQDVKAEQIQSMIDKTAKNAASPTVPLNERAHENERLRALQALAESRKSQ